MVKYNVKGWVLYKSCLLLLALLSAGFVISVIFGDEVYQIRSFFRQSDIIKFERQSVVIVGGIPLFIYGFFFSLRGLFSKGFIPPKKQTVIGFIFLIFSIITVVISYIVMWIFYFLLLSSSYTHCPQENLKRYYVIDPQRCVTIIPNFSQSFKEE